jgi:hypothetical protein
MTRDLTLRDERRPGPCNGFLAIRVGTMALGGQSEAEDMPGEPGEG